METTFNGDQNIKWRLDKGKTNPRKTNLSEDHSRIYFSFRMFVCCCVFFRRIPGYFCDSSVLTFLL